MSAPIPPNPTPTPRHKAIVESFRESWPGLHKDARVEIFRRLTRLEAEDLFLSLAANDQAEIFHDMPESERRSWLRMLEPDDAADLIQQLPPDERDQAFKLLDVSARNEVSALMAYEEDAAGGLMNPRFARLRPEMRVDEAISYLRAQAKSQVENLYTAYVLDSQQHLMGVVSFRDLFRASPDKSVNEIMEKQVMKIPDDMDQEEVSRHFSKHNLTIMPVVDKENKMKGVVTIDDIVGVVQEEATEDIHKLGGMEVLEAPYLNIGFFKMIQKRAGWLTILFLGEMLTAAAMGYYEKEIERAVVLALFIPLIISSGGNSGSQATTLIIRSLALGEVKLRDWWRVLRRELASGLTLGLILGAIGLMKIVFWPSSEKLYGEHYKMLGCAVGASLLGVVLWGTVVGSMLPFLLRRLGLDPASASAPFVATLVDVTGLVIYFSVASLFLHGAMI
ncbi:MAG: magnesium transporter [Bacteriovoracia bacterium]